MGKLRYLKGLVYKAAFKMIVYEVHHITLKFAQ